MELEGTLAAYLGSNLDRRRAARRLHVHPNTLDYRLRHVHKLTGLDVHRTDDLVVLALALRQNTLAATSQHRSSGAEDDA